MGFNELLNAIRELTPAERQSLLIEAALIDDPIIEHGLTAKQWAEIKEAERKMDAGETKGVPAIPYLRALMAKKSGSAL